MNLKKICNNNGIKLYYYIKIKKDQSNLLNEIHNLDEIKLI